MRGQFHRLPIDKISKQSFVGGNRYLSMAVNSAAAGVIALLAVNDSKAVSGHTPQSNTGAEAPVIMCIKRLCLLGFAAFYSRANQTEASQQHGVGFRLRDCCNCVRDNLIAPSGIQRTTVTGD